MPLCVGHIGYAVHAKIHPSMTNISQQSAPLKGIAFMVASALFMGINNAILKLLTEGLPAGEIMFLRSFMILPLILLYAYFRGGWSSLRVYRWRGHSARAVCLGFSAYFFILSVQFLPLATTVALTFAAPLLITAMAGSFLKEEVGWRRWSAVGVGFLGVVIITRPGSDVFQLTALLPLACALASAGRDVITRSMTAGESSIAIMLTANVGMAVFGLFSIPFGWEEPDSRSIWLIAACVPLVAVGHYTMIEALRYAEAAVASPFRYSAIVWAGLLGYFIWGDVPDSWSIVGTCIVIASGVYILHREFVHRREVAE